MIDRLKKHYKKIVLIATIAIINFIILLLIVGFIISINTNLSVSQSNSILWNAIYLLLLLNILIFIKPIYKLITQLYLKFKPKTEITKKIKKVKPIVEKPFDYKKESLKLLAKAETISETNLKEAFFYVAQAIRLYYIHKLELKKEITNSKLIQEIKKNKIKHIKIQECLNNCQLVEFAKMKPTKKDFNENSNIAKLLIQ